MNQYYLRVAYKRTGMVEKVLLVIWINTTYKWHTRGQAWSRRFYQWYESILHTSGIQEDRHGREGFISDMNQYYIQLAYKRTGMVEKVLPVIWINTTYKWHTRGQAWSRRFYQWYESILHTSGIQEDRHGREGFISDINQYYIQVLYKRTGMVENILLVIWINTTYEWHTRGQAWSRRFWPASLWHSCSQACSVGSDPTTSTITCKSCFRVSVFRRAAEKVRNKRFKKNPEIYGPRREKICIRGFRECM